MRKPGPILKVASKLFGGSVGDRRSNEGYGVARGVPLPSGVGYEEGLYPSEENFRSIRHIPLELVSFVHFRTNLCFYVEGP